GHSPILYLYRVVQGVGYSIFVTFCYAYIASHAPPGRRAEALGVFGLSFFIPTSIGGVVGEYLIRWVGFGKYFIIGSAVALLAAIPPFFIRDRMAESGLSPSRVRSVLSAPILRTTASSLFFGATFGGIFTFLPVFLYRQGKDGIGLFLFLYSVAVIATRTAWRRVTDRADRRKSSTVSFLLLAGGAALLIFAGETLFLAAASLLTGLGHGFLFPSLSALTVDLAGRENSGFAMALFTGAFDLGLVFGAGFLGLVLEVGGFATTFGACSLLALAGCGCIPRGMRGKREVSGV
ncbi:MAG: MFS transporter, partial [Deltaproteobacteria bacterium]